MRYVVVSVRDRASDAFGRPVVTVSEGAAKRSFADEVNRADPGNPLYQHPEDYDLYLLGSFSDHNGMFETGVPQMIAVGKDLVKKPE